jgi:CBS domain containing-hemolysin-like protein
MVPILLLVGEITPKTLAIRNNVAFASFQARPIEIFALLITPLRRMVRLVADWVTTLIVGRERSRANIITEDMVRTLAREAVGEGTLDVSEAQYIDQIFDFGNKTVEEVMTPRSNILFLPIDMPLPEIIGELRRTRRTKVPVYGEHRDNILGILYARDLLGLDAARISGSRKGLRELLREPYFVPESKLAADLFNTFRNRKLSLALTVDEYGGVTGLVSMEDLLECIFGDLPSASDAASSAVTGMECRRLPDGSLHVDGTMSIEYFNSEFGENLPVEDAETVGGLVLDRFGELPAVGTTLVVEGVEFVVDRVENNRIRQLSVKKAEIASGSMPDGTQGEAPGEAASADDDTTGPTPETPPPGTNQAGT